MHMFEIYIVYNGVARETNSRLATLALRVRTLFPPKLIFCQLVLHRHHEDYHGISTGLSGVILGRSSTFYVLYLAKIVLYSCILDIISDKGYKNGKFVSVYHTCNLETLHMIYKVDKHCIALQEHYISNKCTHRRLEMNNVQYFATWMKISDTNIKTFMKSLSGIFK